MTDNSKKIVSKIGLWAAVFTVIFGMAYIIALFATLAGLLKPPWDMAYEVLPSIFLAPSFLVLMIAIHNYVPEERRIWSNIGMAFAIIYTTIVSIVYFTVLSVVLPNMLHGTVDKIYVLNWLPNSFLQNVDGIGYGFMSLATLFSAFAFARIGIELWARRFMIAHGIIIIGVIGSVFIPVFFAIAILWIITFPLFSITLLILFKKAASE
jgi:hypothetical protein